MIYLDYNASTPVDPAVREAMLPYLGDYYGNPSSPHLAAAQLQRAIRLAREQVADLLGAHPDEIVFTSGGTESNNHVIKGVAAARMGRGRHIITSSIEHPAVIQPCRFLEKQGFEVSYVKVDETGLVDPHAIAEKVRQTTILISVMHANNEVGTIEPIGEIAEIARQGGVWMHTDAAQSIGKIAVRVDELGVDFLTVAGHKLYAPQGVGALYVRKGIEIEPLMHGAGHEQGRRAGTEAVSSIVGLGAAAEMAKKKLGDGQIPALRDRLWNGLREELGDAIVLNGHPEKRLPNTLSVGFRGLMAVDLLVAMPDLCASAGAACHGDVKEKSPVLAAMNVPDEVAFGTIRFSVGRGTTKEEIDEAIRTVVGAVCALRKAAAGT
jgi:cysteine desulfurase